MMPKITSMDFSNCDIPRINVAGVSFFFFRNIKFTIVLH